MTDEGIAFIQKVLKKGCNCFTAGTEVLTDEGEKDIEDIEVGDMVLAKDEETGEVAYKEVTATFNHETDEIYNIYVGGQTIESTFNHPFYANDKGWTFAKDLKVGDLLVQSDGHTLRIDSIEIEQKYATVYNMTVDDFHTFFVSDLGIWVHNTGPCWSGSSMSLKKAPQQVQDVLSHIKSHNGSPPKGLKGGKTFGNTDGTLPGGITYKEYDVNPKTGATRDAERIVIGSDGSVYYTTDHYKTFTKLE